MAKFSDKQRDEIQETLEFWEKQTQEKCAAVKATDYIKKREALSYAATLRALNILTKSNNDDVKDFWSAAIYRWGDDFIKYIPLKIYNMYTEYYIVTPIDMKERNRYVAKILTAIRKIEKDVRGASIHGNALSDRLSIAISESYQPDDIGKHPNLDDIGFYPLLHILQNEVRLLAVSTVYVGFDNMESRIDEGEKQFIKTVCKKRIIKNLEYIAKCSRDDKLGSYLEQAFSVTRNGCFFPKSSSIPKPDYQIIHVLPFLDRIKSEIIRLKTENVFYRHHIAKNKRSRYKALGITMQDMVGELCGDKKILGITSSILSELHTGQGTVNAHISNWNKKIKNTEKKTIF